MELNELNRKREQYRVNIRKQQINSLMKYKRKAFQMLHQTYSQSKLYQIYEIIHNNQIIQIKHLLQQLSQQLTKEIDPQYQQLQLYFLKFVLSISDPQYIEYVIQIIGLICFDIPELDQYSPQIYQIIFNNLLTQPRIRQKCLLTLTNFSATDNQITLSILYQQERIFKQLIYMLEQYSISNDEKLNMAGFFMNMVMSARVQILNNIQLIYLISNQNYQEKIIEKCALICKLLLSKFGQNLLQFNAQFEKSIQNLLNYALVKNNCLEILELINKILEYHIVNFNHFLLQNNLIDLIIDSTQNPKVSIRIQSLKIIKKLLVPENMKYFNQRLFSNRLNIIIKGFYEQQILKPYILQILIQAITDEPTILALFQQQVFDDLILNFQVQSQEKSNIQKMLLFLQNLSLNYKNIPKHLLRSMKQIADKSFYSNDEIIQLCSSQLLNILNDF